MTIALDVKVNAGLVLAADSASTVMVRVPSGQVMVVRSFENARKLFQVQMAPIGILTWGIGGIGEISVEETVLAFTPRSAVPISVQAIAEDFRAYVKALYDKSFEKWPNKPALGFMICGFSTGETRGEEYQVIFPEGNLTMVRNLDEFGLTWNGQIEAITRLEKGHGMGIQQAFQVMGVTQEQIQKFMGAQPQFLEAGLFDPVMPLQDAVDLARFLIQTTIQFERFKPGAPTCGGPVDLAVITHRAGFKWVAQKSIR